MIAVAPKKHKLCQKYVSLGQGGVKTTRYLAVLLQLHFDIANEVAHRRYCWLPISSSK